MKDLDPDKLQDKTAFSDQREIKKAYRPIAKLRVQPGQRAFQLHVLTGVITEAEVEHGVKLDAKGNTVSDNKIKMVDGCIYCVALNKKNSMKKFIQLMKAMQP